jgi:hypothetical protein
MRSEPDLPPFPELLNSHPSAISHQLRSSVACENDFLTLESPADWGLPKLRIRPESQQDFFATELPVQVTSQTGPDGKVRSLTIYPPRGQKGVPANKLASEK